MFCPNCGKEFDNGSAFCGHCGFSVADTQKDESDQKSAEIKKDIKAVKGNVKQISKKSVLTQPLSLKSIKENPKMIKIIVAVLVFAIVIIAVMPAIFTAIKKNSYDYKLQQAITEINSGNYDMALSYIEDFGADEKEAITEYIDLLKERDYYLEICNNNSDNIEGLFRSEYKNVMGVFSEFIEIVLEFDSEGYADDLPEALQLKAESIISSTEYINDFMEIENDLYNNLYIVQYILQANVAVERSKKGGPYFTLNEIQGDINSTKSALDILWGYDLPSFKIPDKYTKAIGQSRLEEDEYGHCYAQISSLTESLITSLLDHCQNEVYENESYIAQESKKFDMSAELFRKKPNLDYKEYIDWGMNCLEVISYEEMDYNRNYIFDSIRIEMLAYLVADSDADVYWAAW